MWKVIITTAKGSYALKWYKTKKEATRIAEEFLKVSKETVKAEVIKTSNT